MVKKIIFLILLYFLVLMQSSFFPHFGIFSGKSFFNLVFILVILINLFEKREGDFGILCAFWSGFFHDIFCERFIGPYLLIFLSFAIFIKFFLKQYVQLFEQRKRIF